MTPPSYSPLFICTVYQSSASAVRFPVQINLVGPCRKTFSATGPSCKSNNIVKTSPPEVTTSTGESIPFSNRSKKGRGHGTGTAGHGLILDTTFVGPHLELAVG